MSTDWYSRSIVLVRDASQALEFYASKLGFKEDWIFEEDDQLQIVQVSRSGCELILSGQWPREAGNNLTFVSLDADHFASAMKELVDRGVELTRGIWGRDLVVVEDIDGNRIWFPFPEGLRWEDVFSDERPGVCYWGRQPLTE
jgi:catechol 2,3-dioxygenase-like lactoylglutathione lyase family enzyme